MSEPRGGGGLTAEQLRNAQVIYRVGKQMGMSVRDIQIALITAMQESSLRNLNYGDRDSLGLFQQRPSQGWGTVAQVTDPVYASRKFYSTLKGLGERRYDMSMTQAAQAVQRSAYPDAYAKHIPLVRRMYPDISDSKPAQFDGLPGQQDSVADINKMNAQAEKGVFPMGDPRQRGGGSPYDGMTVAGMDAGDPTNVLAAQYSPVLAAPTFDMYGGQQVEQPDYASILSEDTFRQVKDQAASRSGFRPSKGVDGWRAAVVEMARQYIGDPYVWGGSQPGGFDCSGLIQYVYGKAGINLPRVSYQQANSGTRVALNTLRPGDLVAWDNSSRNNGADHIAIYIGDGQIIESPRPGIGVRIRKLGHSEGAWGVRISR